MSHTDKIGNSMKCIYCFADNAIPKKVEHFRICYGCFGIAKVCSIKNTKARKCKKCINSKKFTNVHKHLMRYNYKCEACGKDRVLKQKTKSKLCTVCTFENNKFAAKNHVPTVRKLVKKPKKPKKPKVSKKYKVTVDLTMKAPVTKPEEFPQISREAELAMQEAWLIKKGG